ncbi:hypothetical protein [Gemella morbillorum]|uniref:hypothetical protein n=1 Tax=Gemella morbillorum TaxID=29391 RepID=UPI0028D251D3|nr:hypothetical protein [Gemella morbillorum]
MYEIFYDVLSSGILYKYIFEVIFTGLLFDILGVKKGYALIPFYNIYRLYKEYKGRVWLKNWGKLYIVIFVISLIGYLLIVLQFGYMIYFLIMMTMAFLLPVFTLIGSVVRGAFLVTQFLPILKNKVFKAMLVVNLFSPLLTASVIYMNELYIGYASLLLRSVGIFDIVFLLICLGSAFNIWKKVKSGQYALYEKLDYEKLTYDEIRAELKSRGRMLAYPIEDNKIYYPSVNQETEEKKEDGE